MVDNFKFIFDKTDPIIKKNNGRKYKKINEILVCQFKY